MQLDKTKQKLGMISLAKVTYNTYGVRGFYRGYLALLIFSMPKNSVRFGAFELARSNIFKE